MQNYCCLCCTLQPFEEEDEHEEEEGHEAEVYPILQQDLLQAGYTVRDAVVN